ncbi:MAG: 4-hydroxy-tetrahydrodipicolinate synthase [Gammaproteobacteria bacterium]|nr:4-hydroxy-tetrahydrodipicolinate synthase [Gammaproteobacteria bacterium]
MFQGSIVALVTPMHADGSLDESSLRGLIDYHVEQGTDAIVAMGTTGESATLDAEAHCDVIRIAVEHAAGRVPVIAGSGSNSTDETITLTRCAQKMGADACLLVTPYYNKPTQEGLYRHYRKIAETVAIPQILYNVPGRTACDLLPATVERLAVIDNIIGLKDATADLDRVKEHLERCGESFALYSGDDATAMEFILLGGKGGISVTANVAPRAIHEIYALALAGKRAEAEMINAQFADLHKVLFAEPNPIPVKWALQTLGMIGEGIRLPLLPLSPAYHEALTLAMRNAGVL